MTPKEKAIELIERFNIGQSVDGSKWRAKKSALICVEEILISKHTFGGDDPYWNEVEREIKKYE